jgi:hypothetical protein
MLLDPHRRATIATADIGDALAAGLSPIFVVGAALGLAAVVVSLFYPSDTRGEAGEIKPGEAHAAME